MRFELFRDRSLHIGGIVVFYTGTMKADSAAAALLYMECIVISEALRSNIS